MGTRKKASGPHDSSWGMIGFMGSPKDKALVMLVSEGMETTQKDAIMDLVRRQAFALGIIDARGKITERFAGKFQFYVDRILLARGIQNDNKKGQAAK